MSAVIPSIERDDEGSYAREESLSPQQTPCPGPSRKRCAAIASGPADSPKMRIMSCGPQRPREATFEDVRKAYNINMREYEHAIVDWKIINSKGNQIMNWIRQTVESSILQEAILAATEENNTSIQFSIEKLITATWFTEQSVSVNRPALGVYSYKNSITTTSTTVGCDYESYKNSGDDIIDTPKNTVWIDKYGCSDPPLMKTSVKITKCTTCKGAKSKWSNMGKMAEMITVVIGIGAGRGARDPRREGSPHHEAKGPLLDTLSKLLPTLLLKTKSSTNNDGDLAHVPDSLPDDQPLRYLTTESTKIEMLNTLINSTMGTAQGGPSIQLIATSDPKQFMFGNFNSKSKLDACSKASVGGLVRHQKPLEHLAIIEGKKVYLDECGYDRLGNLFLSTRDHR
ncbi:hypothetical protein MBM_08577 [Drepanopeziza brunnea f. sp. 'multigermtubi' MB_m1]|uniref:Uncharacterized protein n=1 Tax=Marssonina brunnea f. sp. multigermtubi (strain MB_m1) TaxID=1072389 RepID=K1XL42_MARBU|nr:uncharacterized protein MBM_08577 [Drepanopeziza brunnea f. sp. 'multigermtubi' MB_m1]EKD13134.1 hypothetical protein MBM_08577 [Drepanopeziza brunnea f. sp. 'multigermtubi' MB_m1]